MATIALFISPSEIKEKTFVDENVDEKSLREAILWCQEEYTKSVLGTALYNEIKGEIENGTITADNTTLRDSYIRPALRWWVIYEAMDELHMKATNKAIMTKRSDNSDPVNLNDILMLKSKYQNRAQRMDEKLRLYLIENSTTYPLYLNAGSGADTIHPKNFTYGTNWYLGGTDNYLGLDVDRGDNCCD